MNDIDNDVDFAVTAFGPTELSLDGTVFKVNGVELSQVTKALLHAPNGSHDLPFENSKDGIEIKLNKLETYGVGKSQVVFILLKSQKGWWPVGPLLTDPITTEDNLKILQFVEETKLEDITPEAWAELKSKINVKI